MSVEAKHLKKGNYVFVENNVFIVLRAEELTVTGNHSVRLQLQNFMTNHRTVKSFGLKHHVRTLEPVHTHYNLVDLLDNNDGRQFLSLINRDTDKPEESVHVEDVNMIKYLQNYFDKNDEPLQVVLTRIDAPKMHRIEKDMYFERVTSLQGFDMSHQHDPHHHHHHVHSHSS